MHSMTGFGIARGKVGRSHLVVEARSVNHRFCEISLKGLGSFSLFEPDVARLVRGQFSRGKFDLFVRSEQAEKEDKEIDLAKRSHQILKKIQAQLGIKGPISLAEVLAFRGILFAHAPQEDAETLRRPFADLCAKAMQGLKSMRAAEGKRLYKWFEGRERHMGKLIDAIEKESAKRSHQYRQRLERKFQSSQKPLEEGRMIQEAALMAERADVMEEIVRLRSHLKELGRLIRLTEPTGRKLDFLAQEMGREINTIGSKSQGVKLTHQVVEFKTDLERIREQVQNVE